MPKEKKEVKEKGVKKISPYNQFMKDELARLKKESPEMDHKQRFKQAAENVSDDRSRREAYLAGFLADAWCGVLVCAVEEEEAFEVSGVARPKACNVVVGRRRLE